MCCESSLMFCFGSDRPPPVVAAHSVRALSLGRVLKSCAYPSSVCMTVRTKRRAHHLNIVTQPIFSSSIHPYQCRIFIFYFDFFLRIPETLKEFRNFVAVLLFNFVFVCISWHCLYATSIFHLLECIQFEIGPRVGWCTLSLVVYYKNSSCCWFMRSSSVLEAHVLRSTRLVASFHIKKTNRVKHGLVSIALTKQRT